MTVSSLVSPAPSESFGAFGEAPPSPMLSRRLLDLARQRKKAGRHVLTANNFNNGPSVSRRLLVLSPPVGGDDGSATGQVPDDVLASMLDQARIAKRKGLHQLSEDGSRLLLSSSGASVSTAAGGASSASSSSRTYFSCASVL